MNDYIRAFLKSLFPQRCAYCGKVISADRLACDSCQKALSRIDGKVCCKCGRGIKLCSCRGEKYFVSQSAPFYYEGVVRNGLHRFKFRKGQQNAEAFCEEMAKTVSERYADVTFDCIVAVPMTKKSIRQRGYNQIDILCRRLEEKLGVRYESNALIKLYETRKQHGISLVLRRGNLTGVFDVPDREIINGKTVLLCDDISTSGETFNECAKMLWLSGAKEVRCISVALTRQTKNKDNINII